MDDIHTFDTEAEIPLTGLLAEFRIALREEIEAARRNASSMAIPLTDGRRIAQIAGGHQYVFSMDSVLNAPNDAPADLLVPGHSSLIEATIIAIEGLAITLSLSIDLGKFVPSARLQSNLTLLMKRLIARIEEKRDTGNPAGNRILGNAPIEGQEAWAQVPAGSPPLNQGQTRAVARSFGDRQAPGKHGL
jgi:hypothetical protein